MTDTADKLTQLVKDANEAHQKSIDAAANWREAKAKLDERFERNNYTETNRREIIEKDWDLSDATSDRKYWTDEAMRRDSLVTRLETRRQTRILTEILETQKAILTALRGPQTAQNERMVPRPRVELEEAA